MKITCTVFVLLIQTLQCLASDESPFQLTNKDTGFCLVKTNNQCTDIRWTTGDRLLVQQRQKCLGVQGKSVGSGISLYDCDEKSDLQKWQCKNGTLIALKGQDLYIELTADNTATLSKTVGPNNHLTITGTSTGACTRTYREFFSIGGNAAGQACMFPFLYKDQWYSECTKVDSTLLWCAVETKYESERWGLCPVTSKEGWTIHPTTGEYYQLNTESALTWPQADTSCKQQGASLLSITDPHQQAYVTALLGAGGNKLWSGMVLDPEHGWTWSNGAPYRYMKWDSGHPLPNPGHNCAIIDPAVQYSWQSSPCTKKLGYICYSKATEAVPTQATETGFCASSWIPYNGHCFHLNRTERTWSDAQRECRNGGGDLVSIRNVEDQSFVISQLGYKPTDQLWIGLNDRKTEGLFDWADHSTVSFTSWEPGKPTVSSDIKDCILIKGEKGNWADHVCEEKHGSICMKMSVSTPIGDIVDQAEGCKKGWRRHGSYCYFIGTQTKTFDEAKDDCTSSNSYLADVSSGVDNAFLVSMVGLRPEKYFWLGLSNQKNIDQFVWTNTDTVRFTHWNARMPGHEQGCVAMTTGIFAGLWDVLPCTNKEKYICKHQAEGTPLTPAPPSVAPPKCADGWTQIGSRKHCYKYFSQSYSNGRTWFEARDFCKTVGGDLISIHSTEDLQSLPSRYGRVWIGLSAPDPVTGYVWSDGSPLQFQHWEDGEPNNKMNVESCAEYDMDERYSSGSWNDVHCETYHSWLCQILAGTNPKPTPPPVTPDFNRTADGWLDWNGTQYYINTRSMAMEEARRYCQNMHGDLVSLHSEAERVFLWKQVSRNYGSFWIGLNVDLDRTFGWMDGSVMDFQRWDENQPAFTRNDENCAVMTTSMGFWHDYNCGYEHRSICKRGGTPPANTTVKPTVVPTGGCPLNWKKFDSKCYNIITAQKDTWQGAKTQCKAMKGNLVSITTRKVQAFLASKMAEAPTTNLWIGMYNVNDGPFLWTDGKSRKYSNWGSEWDNSRYDMDYMSYSYNEKACGMMTTDSNVGIGKWLKKPCKDTNGYICLQDLDPTISESPEPTTTDYINIFNDSIKFISQEMNWNAAKKHCEADGANLASIRNQWSKTYIDLLALKAPAWIGLNKEETGGYFRYIGGWRLSMVNWARGEPSSSCVYVDEDGKWRTAACTETKSSICMKTTDVAPTESSVYPGFCPDDPEQSRHSRSRNNWIPFRGYCYLFFTDRIEWPDASANCVRHGGHLVSIEDPAEQEFIAGNIVTYEDSQSSFWLGLYRTHAGLWKWLDNTPLDYTNWRGSKPSDNSYGSIKTSDGKWTTGNRWYDRGYICKTPKIIQEVVGATAHPAVDVKARGHVTLAAVLVIAIVTGVVILLYVFKKSGRRLPIPDKLSTFDNPLFFNNERAQPDLVDTKKLVVNAEEENPAPVLAM